MNKHTPTPWSLMENGPNRLILGDGQHVATVPKWDEESGYKDKENAAFIVRAVNSHEELLAAAKKALDHITDFGPHNHEPICVCGYCELKRAITKAEKKL